MSNVDQLDARKETVGGLMSFSNVLLPIVIPTFQREYRWDSLKVADLLKHTDPDESSFGFIGTMVFVRNSNGELQVVDGQQRILSTLVILCAIRDYLRERASTSMVLEKTTDYARKFNKLSDSIQDDYIYKIDFVTDENLPRVRFTRPGFEIIKNNFLELDKSSNDVKKDIKSEVDQESKLFYNNYEYITTLLKARYDSFRVSEDLLKLIQTRIKKLRALAINAIYISNEDYAMEVFETINALGVTLKLPDLIKNYLFKSIKNQSVESDWKSLVTNLSSKDERIDRLIRYDWSIKEDIPANNDLYRLIKSSTDEPAKYMARILKSSKLMKFLYEPTVDNFKSVNFWFEDNQNYKNEIIHTLQGINLLTVKAYSRLFLALHLYGKNSMNIKDISRILKLFENFQLRALITKARTNDIEKLYGSYSRKLYVIHASDNKDEYKKQAIRSLLFDNLPHDMKKMIPDDDFLINFSSFQRNVKSSKDARISKYLYAGIEALLNRSEAKLDYTSRYTTLEEVLPQSYEEFWPNATVEDREVIFSIGNMTILKQPDNGSASNFDVKRKLEIYQKSTLQINRELSEFLISNDLVWNKSAISKRADKLAEYALEVWTLDFKNVQA